MMSGHFRLSSELSGVIAKRLPHAKNQFSVTCSFFNQFVTGPRSPLGASGGHKLSASPAEQASEALVKNDNVTNCMLQARFACLRCAAGGHFVTAGGAPGVTIV